MCERTTVFCRYRNLAPPASLNLAAPPRRVRGKWARAAANIIIWCRTHPVSVMMQEYPRYDLHTCWAFVGDGDLCEFSSESRRFSNVFFVCQDCRFTVLATSGSCRIGGFISVLLS